MAFFSKVGNVLKQGVGKQITSQFSAPTPSIYQAIRCMSSSKLFVGGLPWAVDDTNLRETFSQYGQVVEARVIVDREQSRSRGFGFVTFASTEEASSAIQAMDGQDMQGRRLRVNYATERAPRPYGGGGGYGGGQNFGNYGGSPGGYPPSGGGGYGDGNPSFGGGNYGVAGGVGGSDSYFGGGAPGGNPTAETGFGNSGFEDGPADHFGNSGDNFRDDDEPNDFAKRA